MNKKLIFVYNADSGIFNTLADAAHKIFSPKTYSCNLCAITYSNLGMKSEWKAFIEKLPIKSEFLHKDQLREQYGMDDIPLPAIFILEDKIPQLLIGADKINACESMADLKQLVRVQLPSWHWFNVSRLFPDLFEHSQVIFTQDFTNLDIGVISLF